MDDPVKKVNGEQTGTEKDKMASSPTMNWIRLQAEPTFGFGTTREGSPKIEMIKTKGISLAAIDRCFRSKENAGAPAFFCQQRTGRSWPVLLLVSSEKPSGCRGAQRALRTKRVMMAAACARVMPAAGSCIPSSLPPIRPRAAAQRIAPEPSEPAAALTS